MITRYLSLTMVVFSSFQASSELRSQTIEPTINELIDMAPVISTATKLHGSIKIGGFINLQNSGSLRFAAIYRAPDRCSLLISDGTDATPLLYAADNNVLIYDPVRPVVLCESNTKIEFCMDQVGDKFQINLGWGKDKSNLIRLDINSLFTGPSTNDSVIKTGDGQFRLTRVSRMGNFLISDIDINSKEKFTKLQFVKKNEKKPFICIDQIIFDEQFEDDASKFPLRSMLAQEIAVKDMFADTLIESVGGLALLFRASYVRVAAKEPEARDAMKGFGFPGIDWEEVRRNDKSFSRSLKKLVPSLLIEPVISDANSPRH